MKQKSHSPNIAVVQALSKRLEQNRITLSQNEMRYFIAECALQLLLQAKKISRQPDFPCDAILPISDCTYNSHTCILQQWLENTLPLTWEMFLIEPLIDSRHELAFFLNTRKHLFSNLYTYVPGEDTLGLLWQTLRCIGSRKSYGAYYTPSWITHRLAEDLHLSDNVGTLLEPCCGTGSFLLQLPRNYPFAKIYAMDIDDVAVHAARIQAAIHFRITNVELLFSHIVCNDFLHSSTEHKYDYIIGNPPWGYAFSPREHKFLSMKFACAGQKRLESYDLFFEHALSLLKPSGQIAFVVPEAILTVRSHQQIRKILLEHTALRFITYLGNVFEHVLCPCIILQCEHIPDKQQNAGGMAGKYDDAMPANHFTVSHPDRSFVVQEMRELTPDYLCFYANDEQYRLVKKLNHLPGALFLKNNADFALGIVTGNNHAFLFDTSSTGMEPVWRGNNIGKYRIGDACAYLHFQPEHFQQTAPVRFYRASEKLLYRFISNRLVFAYDNKQRLTLNSCNILIPRIDGLSVKYIMAILNSRAAQFLMDMQYHSIKLLRSHIEHIPIPSVSADEQNCILSLVEQIEQCTDPTTWNSLYDELDRHIGILYELNEEEYQLLVSSTGTGI